MIMFCCRNIVSIVPVNVAHAPNCVVLVFQGAAGKLVPPRNVFNQKLPAPSAKIATVFVPSVIFEGSIWFTKVPPTPTEAFSFIEAEPEVKALILALICVSPHGVILYNPFTVVVV